MTASPAAALTPGAAAALCAGLEAGTPSGWAYITRPNASVVLGLAPGNVIVGRGSEDALDWWHDGISELWRDLAHHPLLGPLPFGFASGVDRAYADIRARLGSGAPVRLTGHSLGAAHVAILAGLLCLDGIVPASVTLFGCPRPGMSGLARATAPIAAWQSYRNAPAHRHDLVTDMPTDPPFDHPRSLIDVAAEPAPGDPWGIFGCHRIQLYQEAVAGLA